MNRAAHRRCTRCARFSTTLRLAPVAALAGVFAIFLSCDPRRERSGSDERGSVAAPSAPSTAPSASATAEPAAPTELAVFALAYQPTTDERGPDAPVIRAQAAVREQPGEVRGYVALAKAFLTRMRETGDLELMAYAKDAINAALTVQPKDREARRVQLMVLFDGHKFVEAAAGARRLLATDSNDTTAYILLSDSLLELGDYEGSIAALQEAMDRYPDLRIHGRTAYLRWLHGDIEGARESLGDAMDLGRGQSEALAWCLVELGVIDWHAGQLERAAAAAERALALIPEYLPALTLQARVAAARGQIPAAISHLENVVALRPNAEELLLLAEWYQRAQQPEKSQEYFARAEKLAPHDPVTLAGYYARHKRNTDQALALAEKAVRARPTVYAQAAHALALWRAGRARDALLASDRALALETPDARLYLQRALIEVAAGRLDAAMRFRDKATALRAAADPILAAELAQALSASPAPKSAEVR